MSDPTGWQDHIDAVPEDQRPASTDTYHPHDGKTSDMNEVGIDLAADPDTRFDPFHPDYQPKGL